MSDSIMSNELFKALGITPNDDGLPMTEPNPADMDFGEEKEPRPDVKFEVELKETSVPDLQLSDAKVDYAYARSLNYTLLKLTTEALARALVVVKETEHPRAFESFNSLAATVRGLNQDLLGMQKIYKEITKGRPELDPPPQQTNVQINGSVNVGSNPGTGSTTDVLKLLQESIDNGIIKPIVMSTGNPEDDGDE